VKSFKQKSALAQYWQALTAIALAAWLALSPLAARAQGLPALGDGDEMSLASERQLGERIVAELYRDPSYVQDAVLQEYAQGVFDRLVRAALARGEMTPEMHERYAWKILLMR